jgi:hypothetical protein
MGGVFSPSLLYFFFFCGGSFMVTEYFDIEKFIDAVHVELDKSCHKEMHCLLCGEVTVRRGIAMLPEKPARPIIFAACELCSLLPEWEKEVDKIISLQYVFGRVQGQNE